MGTSIGGTFEMVLRMVKYGEGTESLEFTYEVTRELIDVSGAA
jgi:hypothetical protein